MTEEQVNKCDTCTNKYPHESCPDEVTFASDTDDAIIVCAGYKEVENEDT